MYSLHGSRASAVFDGKTLKSAKIDNGTQVHLLSAFLHNQAVTVNQLEVDEKTNVIPTI